MWTERACGSPDPREGRENLDLRLPVPRAHLLFSQGGQAGPGCGQGPWALSFSLRRPLLFSLLQFLLIFRKAAAGELQEDSGLHVLARLSEIDVSTEGVKGAKSFFEAKVRSGWMCRAQGGVPWPQ